jgi:hypothetical protein
MAEWTLEVSGRIYGGWERWDTFENDGDTWYGLDFGYGGKDKTSLIKITYFEETYYVTEMFSKAGLTIKNTLREIRNSGVSFTARIYADSAMPLLIEEIRLGGYTGIRKCTKGNVESGIKKVQDKSIVMIGSEDSGLYYAYMTFRRDKNNKLPHEPDELAALRYGINSRKPIAILKNGDWRTVRKAKRTKGYL